MRRAGSYNVQAHVLNARAKLGSYAHLYLLVFLLAIFALTAFFSAPHHSQLTHAHLSDRGAQLMHTGRHFLCVCVCACVVSTYLVKSLGTARCQ